ncbi:MAG: hypothetical protein R2874_09745 [Desulfobacterales bacterium]
MWIRTPLIPEATATPENMAAIARPDRHPPQRRGIPVELCAFNNLCRDKYLPGSALGI